LFYLFREYVGVVREIKSFLRKNGG